MTLILCLQGKQKIKQEVSVGFVSLPDKERHVISVFRLIAYRTQNIQNIKVHISNKRLKIRLKWNKWKEKCFNYNFKGRESNKSAIATKVYFTTLLWRNWISVWAGMSFNLLFHYQARKLNPTVHTYSPKANQWQLTFLYKVGRSVSPKGRYPAIRTNKMTPHDHTSAAEPS